MRVERLAHLGARHGVDELVLREELAGVLGEHGAAVRADVLELQQGAEGEEVDAVRVEQVAVVLIRGLGAGVLAQPQAVDGEEGVDAQVQAANGARVAAVGGRGVLGRVVPLAEGRRVHDEVHALVLQLVDDVPRVLERVIHARHEDGAGRAVGRRAVHVRGPRPVHVDEPRAEQRAPVEHLRPQVRDDAVGRLGAVVQGQRLPVGVLHLLPELLGRGADDAQHRVVLDDGDVPRLRPRQRRALHGAAAREREGQLDGGAARVPQRERVAGEVPLHLLALGNAAHLDARGGAQVIQAGRRLEAHLGGDALALEVVADEQRLEVAHVLVELLLGARLLGDEGVEERGGRPVGHQLGELRGGALGQHEQLGDEVLEGRAALRPQLRGHRRVLQHGQVRVHHRGTVDLDALTDLGLSGCIQCGGKQVRIDVIHPRLQSNSTTEFWDRRASRPKSAASTSAAGSSKSWLTCETSCVKGLPSQRSSISASSFVERHLVDARVAREAEQGGGVARRAARR